MSPSKVTQILDNGYVKLTTVMIVGGAVLAFSVNDARYKLKMEFAVTHLSQKVSEISDKIEGRTLGGWHRDTMERWVGDTQGRNMSLELPDPWDDEYDPRPQ